MKSRDQHIDIIKGFAILMVVLGHSVQFNVAAFDHNVLFRIIYSFHMPLFMFISGYVAYGSFDGSALKLRKRFDTLIIPFLSWLMVTMLINAIVEHRGMAGFGLSVLNAIKGPSNGGLWFLWVLFMNFVALFIAQRIKIIREEIALLLMYLILNGVITYTHTRTEFFGFVLMSWHLMFFTLGYILNKYKEKVVPALRRFRAVFYILFPFLVFFWYRNAAPAEIRMFPQALRGVAIVLYKYLVPISGILTTYFLLERVSGSSLAAQGLNALGRITLEIYAIHFYFVHLCVAVLPLPEEIRIVVTFTVALAASMAVQTLIKKSNLLSRVFFGRKAAAVAPASYTHTKK